MTALSVRWRILPSATAPRCYALRYSTVDVETLNKMTLVGPNKDEPVYSTTATVTVVSDYRGITKGTTYTFPLDSPKKDHFQLEEPAFQQQVYRQLLGSDYFRMGDKHETTCNCNGKSIERRIPQRFATGSLISE